MTRLTERRVPEKPAVGASVGTTLAGYLSDLNPATMTAGGFVGKEAGEFLQKRKAVKAEAKAMKKMEKEMQKAAELGKQSGKNNPNDMLKAGKK